jgi:hypothetical protein
LEETLLKISFNDVDILRGIVDKMGKMLNEDYIYYKEKENKESIKMTPNPKDKSMIPIKKLPYLPLISEKHEVSFSDFDKVESLNESDDED